MNINSCRPLVDFVQLALRGREKRKSKENKLFVDLAKSTGKTQKKQNTKAGVIKKEFLTL